MPGEFAHLLIKHSTLERSWPRSFCQAHSEPPVSIFVASHVKGALEWTRSMAICQRDRRRDDTAEEPRGCGSEVMVTLLEWLCRTADLFQWTNPWCYYGRFLALQGFAIGATVSEEETTDWRWEVHFNGPRNRLWEGVFWFFAQSVTLSRDRATASSFRWRWFRKYQHDQPGLWLGK